MGTMRNVDALDENPRLLEVENLKVYFPAQAGGLFHRKYVHAVDGVSFYINSGEVVGLVGESGSGKTTIGRVIARLTFPTEGRVLFNGREITSFRGRDLKNYRKMVQMIFQDPYESLNPRLTVFSTIAFPLRIQNIMRDKDEIRRYCIDLLRLVGLPEDAIDKYPHELSGGERQRVSIARAIAVKPCFLIADEPVSMLDLSIRSGILNLLMELKNQYGLTYLLTTHDLQVAYYTCDRIIVMYLGKIMEVAPTEDFISHQFHPYSQLLLSASGALGLADSSKRGFSARGEIASAIDPPKGCRFHPCCPFRTEECSTKTPPLIGIRNHHFVACFNPQ
ncbi:MAG: ABC transporter ATP-binding protein [Thermoproteota archaeon]